VDKTSRTLSEDEVRQIGRIIDILNQSTFDHLQLEFGDLKLSIGKGHAGHAAHAAPAAPPPAAAMAGAVAPARSSAAGSPPAAAGPPAAKAAAVEDGTVAVTAPLLGRFYSQPEPGAAPFVTVGSDVNEDTTVGLIEVMKTFNAVRAGVSGTVTEICAQDSQLLEYGQVLLRVRPRSG
jgi:acetyl-CoA carboxylase biotin carboxyl carrier protein